MEEVEDRNFDATTPCPSRGEDGEKTESTSPTPDTTAVSERQSMENPDFNPAVEKEQEYLTGPKLFMTIFALTLAGYLMLLDTSIVSTAIPKITTDFHSLNDVGWYGTAYLLTNCALQPLTGKIYAHFSSKWTLLSFFSVFELGSVLCGAATSSKMLIVGRAVAGLGASGLINGGYTIVHAIMPLHRQPFYLGILVGFAQLGLLSGPLIGGALTQYTSWRWCFYINLPCGGAITPLLLFVSFPDRIDKASKKQGLLNILGKLDVIGFSLFAPATIQLILALQWGGTKYSWNSATIIGLFCGAFGVLLLFLSWEYYVGDEAMIPFSLVRRRVVWSSCLNYACLAGSMLLSTYYLPIYFQAVRNATPVMSGVDLLPSILSTVLSGIVTGGLVSRIGYYLPFAVASGVLNTIGSGLISTFTPTTSVGVWVGYQVLQGAGRGMGFQAPIIAVQNNSSKKEVSVVTALVVFSQNLGGVVFLALGQVIFSNRLRHGLALYAPEVNPQTVIVAGARGVRSVVRTGSLSSVLLAYSKAFDQNMYLTTGAAGGALLAAFGMRWMNIKTAKAEKTLPKQDV